MDDFLILRDLGGVRLQPPPPLPLPSRLLLRLHHPPFPFRPLLVLRLHQNIILCTSYIDKRITNCCVLCLIPASRTCKICKNKNGISTSGGLSMMLPMISIVLLCLIWKTISFRLMEQKIIFADLKMLPVLALGGEGGGAKVAEKLNNLCEKKTLNKI